MLNAVKVSRVAKGITRAAIVEAALALLDERGIDAVTVRAIADRLGVRAPALYWHVKDKQELLDEMGTEIARRVNAVVVGLPDEEWPASLARYARALRGEYLAHRDGARTFAGTRLTDPQVLRDQEPWLRRAVERGLSLEQVVTATQLVTALVVGFVVEEQERTQSGAARYSVEVRDEAVGDDVPLVRQAGRVLWGDSDERFERLLAVVLAGVSASAPGN